MTIPRNGEIVHLVDSLIFKAIERKASDIHVELGDNQVRVRYRIDGVLYDQQPIATIISSQIVSRMKVLANLNIAEKRIPQDGKFSYGINGRSVDLRISTFPIVYGEKVVVRILDQEHNKIDVDQLGLSVQTLAQFYELITKSSGFILVTGPTGSGKTTTLYAALAEIVSPENNIVTLEDPIEYSLPGITQSQIFPEAGFTFEKGIRSLLRQDPDVIMVGEIRDQQTAHIAIEAALTGHLVLSTLHTNDAPSTITRLMDMGIEPFLINAAVTGVVAQRLARKLCCACRYETQPTFEEHAVFKRIGIQLDRVWKGKGCGDCFNLGYKGRTGIFELMVMTPAMRACVIKNPLSDTLYEQARVDGMRPLIADGIQKVKDGIISLHELVRVVL